MEIYNRNAAYDLSQFEVNSRHKRNVIHIKKSREKAKRDFRAKVFTFSIFVGFALLCVSGVFGYLFGQVQLAELTDEISKSSAELSELESANTEREIKSLCAAVQNEGPVIFTEIPREDKAEINV
ncbi:MAG: hypothetical protein LBP36_02510 [Oscillospiraceae bacterium]|nr:hypothetical protein [Oscillospiraceae bacterium]